MNEELVNYKYKCLFDMSQIQIVAQLVNYK